VLGPHATVAALTARLEGTATPLGNGGLDRRYFGAGLVNAAAATRRGPTGPTGPSGPTGATGSTGSTGSTGATGAAQVSARP
jgi:hypothetical protein